MLHLNLTVLRLGKTLTWLLLTVQMVLCNLQSLATTDWDDHLESSASSSRKVFYGLEFHDKTLKIVCSRFNTWSLKQKWSTSFFHQLFQFPVTMFFCSNKFVLPHYKWSLVLNYSRNAKTIGNFQLQLVTFDIGAIYERRHLNKATLRS